jgi:hypothetical protein
VLGPAQTSVAEHEGGHHLIGWAGVATYWCNGKLKIRPGFGASGLNLLGFVTMI